MLSIRKSQRLFFETFEGMAGCAVEAAGILEAMFRNGTEAFPEHASRIKDVEHRCDDLVHGAVRELNRVFITPFDREDIHDLVTAMDDLVDLMDAAGSRALLFKVGSEVPDAAALAGVMRRQSEKIREAVGQLQQPQAVLERCREIKAMETEGDRLYREAMVRLFEKHHADPIFVIKAKEIIEVLEAGTDAGDRIAIVLERIVLKNQ